MALRVKISKRALLRERTTLFQSFVLPVALLTILVVSLGPNFGNAENNGETLRSFYVRFPVADFYAAVVLLVALLAAGQYASDPVRHLRGPGRALHPYSTYRSLLSAYLSIVTGTALFIGGRTVFFMAVSSLFLNVAWPWVSLSFWILLAGLVLLSATGGCALGLATADEGSSDLLVSLLVYGSALVAGAFYPYPASSRIWNVAPWSPFTHLLTHMLDIMRQPDTPLDTRGYVVWASVLGATGMALLQLRRLATGSRAVRSTIVYTNPSGYLTGWARRRQPQLLCSFGIILLPLGIWLAGPADLVPGDMTDTLGLLYPYADFATVLLLLLGSVSVSPLVDGSAVIRRLQSFRRSFLFQRAIFGTGVVTLSMLVAALLWRPSVPILGYAAGALALFHLWSIVFMSAIAEVSRDRTTYWVFAISGVFLVSFLGGSLWSLARLGRLGRIASFLLPNALLLYCRSPLGPSIVSAQIGVFLVLSKPGVWRWFRRWRRARGYGPPQYPLPHAGMPDRGPMAAKEQNDLAEKLVLSERKRILDEVHDTLGHGITGALWQIRSARGKSREPAVQAILDRAGEGLEQGLTRIRSYLRDSAPRHTTDWSQLHETVQRFSYCPVELSVQGEAGEYHPIAVRRFAMTVKELLTNALRYGEPASIQIYLVRTARFCKLEYREHGRGWGSRGPRMGYGLLATRNLFSEIGGSFHLDHLPGAQGIRVIGIIPQLIPQEVQDREPE